MRLSYFQVSNGYCEGCDKNIRSRVLLGIEVSSSSCRAPIRLCKGCGPIDLELMQFCREMTIGCNDN